MKSKHLLLGAALIVASLSSCQKDDEIIPNPTDAGVAAPVGSVSVTRDALLEQTALALAKSLKDSNLRVAIKQEALKKFDGDFDILYKNFKGHKIDGIPVQTKLAMSRIDSHPNAKINVTQSIAAMDSITNVEKLQIAVPVNCEEWDPNVFTPLVAYIPQDFEEGVTEKIKAFDTDGNVHWLDAVVAPDFPVIVVGTNERTDVEGNVNENLYDFSNARIAGKGEYMHQINCTNLSAIEAWALGAPELEYYVAGSRKGAAVEIVKGSYYKPSKRKDIDNKWVTLDRFIFTWNRPDYDDYIAVKWVEIDDTGALKGLSIKWSAKVEDIGTDLTYDFSKLERFDDAGTMTVWEGEAFGDQGIKYDTGYIAFRLNSK